MERDTDVLVDRLALVIVLGMSLTIRARDGLRSFIGLEAQIADLVLVGFGVVAEAVIAKHEVVIGLQIFGVDRKCLLEFLHRVGITLLQEQDAAELIVNNAIARILREDELEA